MAERRVCLYLIWPLLSAPLSSKGTSAAAYLREMGKLAAQSSNEDENKKIQAAILLLNKFSEDNFEVLKWIEVAGPVAKIGFHRESDASEWFIDSKFLERYGTYYTSFFVYSVRCSLPGILLMICVL